MRDFFLYWHTRLLRNTLGRTQRENLIRYISPLLPDTQISALDIGCGNGIFSHALMQAKPNLRVTGIETVARPDCKIEHQAYEGRILPFADQSFDYVLLINVLHHVDDQPQVLREAKRVSRNGIIIKDHYANSAFDFWTLKTMERIGNAYWEINQPFNFLSQAKWNALFIEAGLRTEKLLTKFVSYNRFADIFMGRNLHFIAYLKAAPSTA